MNGPDPSLPAVLYRRMRWNSPLSEEHAELLRQRLAVQAGDMVADLGCGWGELLIRVVAGVPDGRGIGVDSAGWALERARAAAAERGLSDRLTFVAEDAATWTGTADRVLCLGAAHAWGGTAAALRGLVPLVRPGGRLLFGDGCWESAPTAAAAELFGEETLSLGPLVDEAGRAGWRVVHLSTADQREWDDFESTYRAGREEWLVAHPDDERVREVRDWLDRRWQEYLTVYRRALGFAYLVLAR